jgi:hypothetical protein
VADAWRCPQAWICPALSGLVQNLASQEIRGAFIYANVSGRSDEQRDIDDSMNYASKIRSKT